MKEAIVAFTLFLVLSPAIQAEESKISLSGSARLTSNYLFRGRTQSNDKPAAQVSFELEFSGFYTGLWSSNVDFGTPATIETDYYAGYIFSGDVVETDIGIVYYDYPGEREIGYYESYVDVSMSTWGFSLHVTDDLYAEKKRGLYGEIDYNYSLDRWMDVRASLGYQDQEEYANFTAVSLSARKAFDGIDVSIGYSLNYRPARESEKSLYISISTEF